MVKQVGIGLVLVLILCLPYYADAAKKVGILYEGWHGFAKHAIDEVAARGGVQLTVEDVMMSNGKYLFSDIYEKYNLEQDADRCYWHTKPADGFYCIYRKRQGEQGYVPDCANITQTLTRHANQLLSAGVDHIVVDCTNLPVLTVEADVIQLRPSEVLFEEWYALRQKGTKTPQIALWANLVTGSTIWKNYLVLYNNPIYSDLILKDPVTGKRIMFTINNPDDNLVRTVENNGGRNDIIVQVMWALIPPDELTGGKWAFFSPCMMNGKWSSSIANTDCEQVITQNSKLGTQIAVSPSYQLGYSSVPFQAPGKLSGLTFKKQFHNALKAQADWVFISSWNEFIAQPQPNSWKGKINTAFNVGFPNDPEGYKLFADTYLYEYSRDIEPSAVDGSYIYNVMASCLRVYHSGATTCNNPAEDCCNVFEGWSHVWSLQAGGAGPNIDHMVSANQQEVQQLIRSGVYTEICNAFYGSQVFCWDSSYANGEFGPFMLYNINISTHLTIPLYRCKLPNNKHFMTTQSSCAGYTLETQLGWISTIRHGETPRSLSICYNKDADFHYHTLDMACVPGQQSPGVIGYVR